LREVPSHSLVNGHNQRATETLGLLILSSLLLSAELVR